MAKELKTEFKSGMCQGKMRRRGGSVIPGRFLPGTGGRGIVRESMETAVRRGDSGPQRPGGCIGMIQRTADSAGSALIFVRISCFYADPVKYTDPDGRSIDNLNDLVYRP
jgi:hypothetical protein